MIYARTKKPEKSNRFFKRKPESARNVVYIPPTSTANHPTPILADHLSGQIALQEDRFDKITNQNIPADIKANALTKTLKNIKNLDKARRRKSGAIFKVTKQNPPKPHPNKGQPFSSGKYDNDGPPRAGGPPLNLLYEPQNMHLQHLYGLQEDGNYRPPTPHTPPAGGRTPLAMAKMASRSDPEKKKRLAKRRKLLKDDLTPTPTKPKRTPRSKNLFTGDNRLLYGQGLKKKFKAIPWYRPVSTSKHKTRKKRQKKFALLQWR